MYKWVSGDGGPLIILQKPVCDYWQGATDFENCLMNGGTVETDYDKICQCEDGVSIINRYEHDLIVLSDSEWRGLLYQADSGEIIVLQSFGSDIDVSQIITRCQNDQPSLVLDFELKAQIIRLLVGADTGKGKMYGFSEISVQSGKKRCSTYYYEDAQVVLIRDAEQLFR